MTAIASSKCADRFRLALVGAGLITRESHLPTALSLPEVEVSALVDPVVERAREIATRNAIHPMVTGRVEDVIGHVDGAVIATPNHTHREVAVPLLESGISCFIEKPLATTVEEGEAILAAAERGRAQVALGHYQRFQAVPHLLRKLLGEEYFGHVSGFCTQFGTAGGWPSMSAYTLKRENVGGGVLVVSGTHFLDLMLHIWGVPDEVSLMDDSLGGPESHCEGTVRYVHGPWAPLDGHFRYSKCVALPPGLVLESEAGTVLIKDGLDEAITLIPRDRPDLRLAISAAVPAVDLSLSPNQRMLRDFVRACAERRPPEVDGRQGLELMRLVRRFYENRHGMDLAWTTEGRRA